MPRNKSYRYNITYQCPTGTYPDTNYLEADVTATSVPRVVSKFYRQQLEENGLTRRDLLIIDVQNMDIC